jgi:integrase
MTGELDRAPVPAVSRRAGALSDTAREAVAAGMPASTRRAYREDVERFERWCEATGRPGLPTDGDTLTEYATHLAGDRHLSPAAIERARWAILKWHALAELPPPSTQGLVAVLKGYRERLAKAKDALAKPRKAKPVDRDILSAMLGACDRTTAAGQRNAAILLLGFAIAGRRGEIAGLDIGDLDVQERGIQVSVYRQKVRHLDDPVIMPRPTVALCPVAATLAWAETLAGHGRTSGPLFVRINRHDQLARPLTRNGVPIGSNDGRMTGQAVADVIRRTALAGGLGGRWSGHSLRRGFATAAHTAGIKRREIERQGGWTADSRAVSGYIEDADRWLYDVLDGVL